MGMLLVAVAVLLVVCLVLLVALFVKVGKLRLQQTAGEAAHISSMQASLAELSQNMTSERELASERSVALSKSVVQAREAVDNLRESTAHQLETYRASSDKNLGDMRNTLDSKLTEMRKVVDEQLAANLSNQQSVLTSQQQEISSRLGASDKRLAEIRETVDKKLQTIQTDNNVQLEKMRATVDEKLKTLQADNNAQLEMMRATVDEKLQKTLNARIVESFKLVNEQLQQVDRGLGEMKNLAADVGGLKKVLSNVKTRGIVGEIQLGAILKEILAPGQYEENIATVPGSSDRVEFAVRLPGEDGEVVRLPIDSKFPGDTYERLRDAQDNGDGEALDAAWKLLEQRIRMEAKDIHDKYLAPPSTTTFGIMFLPFEGLYAEVANRRGLLERLQQDYRVNVAGPSTMAALLNSLQMGFQTVAIQNRANEIQEVLQAVKTEFAKYQDVLGKAQRQLGTVSKTIDSLVGTRARAMDRKLRSITVLDSLEEADQVLGINSSSELLPEPDGSE